MYDDMTARAARLQHDEPAPLSFWLLAAALYLTAAAGLAWIVLEIIAAAASCAGC